MIQSNITGAIITSVVLGILADVMYKPGDSESIIIHLLVFITALYLLDRAEK